MTVRLSAVKGQCSTGESRTPIRWKGYRRLRSVRSQERSGLLVFQPVPAIYNNDSTGVWVCLCVW
jgi:hypothetical protein